MNIPLAEEKTWKSCSIQENEQQNSQKDNMNQQFGQPIQQRKKNPIRIIRPDDLTPFNGNSKNSQKQPLSRQVQHFENQIGMMNSSQRQENEFVIQQNQNQGQNVNFFQKQARSQTEVNGPLINNFQMPSQEFNQFEESNQEKSHGKDYLQVPKFQMQFDESFKFQPPQRLNQQYNPDPPMPGLSQNYCPYQPINPINQLQIPQFYPQQINQQNQFQKLDQLNPIKPLPQKLKNLAKLAKYDDQIFNPFQQQQIKKQIPKERVLEINQQCKICDNQFPRFLFPEHLKECEKQLVEASCKYCSDTFIKQFLEDHEKQCPMKNQSNKAQCDMCSDYVNLSLLKQHKQNCPKQFEEKPCRYCKELLLNIQMSQHYLECVMKVELEFDMLEDQKECSICCIELATNDDLKVLACRHVFHSQCIQQWIARQQTCPMCSQPIKN